MESRRDCFRAAAEAGDSGDLLEILHRWGMALCRGRQFRSGDNFDLSIFVVDVGELRASKDDAYVWTQARRGRSWQMTGCK